MKPAYTWADDQFKTRKSAEHGIAVYCVNELDAHKLSAVRTAAGTKFAIQITARLIRQPKQK